MSAVNGLLPYLAILAAAIIEGEVAYLAACALVAAGRLQPAGVIVAGAVGAAIGDQAYFYLFRWQLAKWLARFPSLERRAAPLVNLVRRRATLMVLLIRFAPGLRIALAIACAYVKVPPLKFSILNSAAAFVWAIALLAIVGWAGPAALEHVGLSGWKGALVLGVVILILFKVLSFIERRSMSDHQ
ncbi:MAG TPA: VTT domain-containing protein [Vicinamibacterales bacterium]|jgi:membrane protein DedA with SNARE-associated domain|nr:VTT domain-containing protein [Vicinamibacterales bacterium]